MSAFSPRQMFLLDEACRPIAEAFEEAPFLVGTAATRQDYRDVDVRLILDDETYARLVAVVDTPLREFLGLAIGEYLAARTGLPIDFQIQQQTAANQAHAGVRNPLGSARSRTTPETADRTGRQRPTISRSSIWAPRTTTCSRFP